MTNTSNTNNYNIYNIRIDDSKRAIIVTKEFKKKTSIFGSPERNALQEAMKECPTYRVVTKSAPKKKFEDSLSMKDIILYVAKHSGKDSAQMKALLELRGKSVKEAGNKADSDEYAGFDVIKEWFFLTYPDLLKKTENRQNRINEILAEAANNAASA